MSRNLCVCISVWMLCWWYRISDAFQFPMQKISVSPSRQRRTQVHTLYVRDNENDEPIGYRNDLISGANDLGEFKPSKKIPIKREVIVGDPQQRLLKEKEISVTAILKELAAIQAQGPQKYCILGSRHCSFLHQQIVELL